MHLCPQNKTHMCRTMDMMDAAELGKREKKHAEWTQQVYGAIQDSINEQIDAVDSKYVHNCTQHKSLAHTI
jgi:hypothetical protein